MKILVLGGTRFVGRHAVEAALARGHEVTLFHRGQSGPELFPECEHVFGDRRIGLEALGGHEFDVCIDTCGYLPSEVSRSASTLVDRVGHYTFISSVSAHAHPEQPGHDEDAQLAVWDPTAREELTEDNYGPLKAECEHIVRATFGARALVVRPGLVVGPHDPTDRFSWWVARLAQGGEIAAPAPAGAKVQWLDARDLARFIVDLVEARARGAYLAAGPERETTLGEMLGEGLQLGGGDGQLVWIDSGFLLDERIAPWKDLPLWIPEDGPRGIFSADVARARSAGLTTRSLGETFADTLEWLRERGSGAAWQAGLSPAREKALLDRWRAVPRPRAFALPGGREI